MRLGAENYINKITQNKYAEYVPNYVNRKNAYYNTFSDEWRSVAEKADQTMENIVDIIDKYDQIKNIYKKW